MKYCKSVKLSERKIANGKLSLYLDYYPGIRDKVTMQMTKDARHAFSYRHKIPTKWVHGKVYYSKTDIDKVKEDTFEGRENYFSVEDIARNYNLTRMQIYNRIKYYKPRAVRKPPYSYYLIEDVERIFGQIGGENADKDR